MITKRLTPPGIRPRVSINSRQQQDRAISTRRDLLEAARRIFARDGFEMARLQDIAATAGKTRGAFYANFRDKEDVFFALFEENLRREKRQMGEQLSEAGSEDERIEVLARHMLSVIGNRRRMLLALEFKLYAIRHPRRTKRLANLHAALCLSCVEANVEKLIPGFTCLTRKQKRTQTAQVGALLDGIALNLMFDCRGLTDDLILRHLRSALRIALQQD
ncbi:MAG TPA: helix-turn-helix domain-containing protein [Acidobacteriaceae bacterium]|jgi:AcrR family transcriptional regulator|nr:helix-turn-helix domain-containing protein [Acidobacteriaceae bacterium]